VTQIEYWLETDECSYERHFMVIEDWEDIKDSDVLNDIITMRVEQDFREKFDIKWEVISEG
jgi:hypothetical protein